MKFQPARTELRTGILKTYLSRRPIRLRRVGRFSFRAGTARFPPRPAPPVAPTATSRFPTGPWPMKKRRRRWRMLLLRR